MDNQYVIHDAEKEKPGVSGKLENTSDKILIWHGNVWRMGWYSFTNGQWNLVNYGRIDNPTHWTSLPPDPPKPRRWVKREAPLFMHRIMSEGRDEFAFNVPRHARNVICTYEIEEDQP